MTSASHQLRRRPANTTDAGFISSCFLHGARRGHYSIDTTSPNTVRDFRQWLNNMLSTHHDPGMGIDLFMLRHERIGFAMLIDIDDPRPSKELHAFAVQQRHQHRGYGNRMLDMLLEDLQRHVIYARCSPASEHMFRMLQQRNFEHVQDTADGFRLLKRDAPDVSDLDLAGGNHIVVTRHNPHPA